MKSNKDLFYVFVGLGIFLIIMIGGILLAFSLPPFLYARNDCSKVIESRQSVDIQPLVDLDLNIKPGITSAIKDGLPKYYDVAIPPSYDYGDEASIWFYNRREGKSDEYILNLAINNTGAYHEFCPPSMAPVEQKNYLIGARGDTKFCISPIQQQLSDPVGGCKPIERYTSYVVVEKGSLTAKLTEFTSSKDSTEKDAIIRLLAEMLGGENIQVPASVIP